MVLDGETSLVLLDDGEERKITLKKSELIVVPKKTWHRFESPKGVKIMTVTPEPTDHQIEKPK
jgi:mannose-6-phosphate isomerase-like protein (cupin superfamily)